MRRHARKPAAKDIAASYDRFKEFEGKKYTGMKIGRSHKWYYDKGVEVEVYGYTDLRYRV